MHRSPIAIAMVMCLLSASHLHAQEAPRIDALRIEGHERVSEDAIRAVIQHPTDAPLDREQLSRDLRALYATGLFDGIQIELRAEGPRRTLVFALTERPMLTAITLEGDDALPDDTLLEAAALTLFAPLDRAALKAAEVRLRDLYAHKGRPLTRVDVRARPTGTKGTEVEVQITIEEGSAVRITSVSFSGNSALGSDTLGGAIQTQVGGPLWSVRGVGRLDPALVEQDRAVLTALYRDRGYILATVGPPRIRLARDGQGASVHFSIREGPLHTTESVALRGDLIEPEPRLMELVEIAPGNPFGAAALQRSMARIRDRYHEAGYAFANISPVTDTDRLNNRVALTIDIQRGPPVRFGRIEIIGNALTRDKVIRQELTISEGQKWSARALGQSRDRLLRRRIFDTVDVRTHPGEDGRTMDVTIEVKEPERQWIDGAGIGLTPSGDVRGRLSEQNILGTGLSGRFVVVLSNVQRQFQLELTEPRLLGSPWQGSVSLYDSEVALLDFERRATGGELSAGRAWEEIWGGTPSLVASYTLEDVDARLDGAGAGRFGQGLTSALGLKLRWDARDAPLVPTRGLVVDVSGEAAHAATLSERQFLIGEAGVRWYLSPFDGAILKLRGEVGAVNSLDSGLLAPERFFLGGPDTVRGFERGALGPTRRVGALGGGPDDPLQALRPGGDKKLVVSAEALFAVPGTDRLWAAFFFDAGNAWDDGQPISLVPDLFEDGDAPGGLRTSAGVGLWWLSPLGPLRVDMGFPLRRLPGEDAFMVEISGGGL